MCADQRLRISKYPKLPCLCDAFRERKTIERGRRRRIKLSMSFSPFPVPRRPIVLRSPQFARGQNSKTQSNTRYSSTQSSFFLGYEPAVSPSPAASFKGSPFGQASPTFSISNIHTATTQRKDNRDEMPGGEVGGGGVIQSGKHFRLL